MELCEDFLNRVQTFNIQTWFIKTSQLNPYKCAKHGWKNTGYNQLTCSVCQTKLEYEEPDYDVDYDYESELRRVTAFLNALEKSHHPNCPFSDGSVPFRLSSDFVYLNSEAFFQKNLETFDKIPNDKLSLPLLTPKVFDYLGEENVDLLWNYNEGTRNKTSVNAARIFALLGWRLAEVEEKLYLLCPFCGSYADIFYYATSFGQIQNLEENERISVESNKPLFDPADEHRFFCKWCSSERIIHPKPIGWQATLDFLRQRHYPFIRTGEAIIPEIEGSKGMADHSSLLKKEIMLNTQKLRMEREDDLKRVDQLLSKLDADGIRRRLAERRPEIEDIYRELLGADEGTNVFKRFKFE
eukprot:TRINITY_DN11921_c0_g1_i1.p1 TRINITY_DN11921_c0_g1~~TRINITY_DN11921_c0_g1_i1.p1  ORF type:complete len:355 (+),score=80.59 TRINITY_DN11921_c0_g1_i1:125-1189(+)